MTSRLCNMFASIKNGQLARRPFVYQKRKKICEDFLHILWEEGFILGYTVEKSKFNNLKIFLKYKNGEPAISRIALISRPSRKIYYSIKQIWQLDSTSTFIIFSTNKGLKTICDCKKLGIGGEPCILIM